MSCPRQNIISRDRFFFTFNCCMPMYGVVNLQENKIIISKVEPLSSNCKQLGNVTPCDSTKLTGMSFVHVIQRWKFDESVDLSQ